MATTTRRRLSDQKRDERRAEGRERLKQAAEQLLTSEGWQRWVRVRARGGLARLSLNNQLLVALAMPDATFVAGFKAWLALGYCVRKGETAIRITAPMPIKDRDDDRSSDEQTQTRLLFKAVSVFDTLSRDLLRGVVGRCGRSFEPRGLELGNAPAAAALASMQQRGDVRSGRSPRCR